MKDLYFQENHYFSVGNVVFQEDNTLDDNNTRWSLASINNYGKILGIVDVVENKTCFSVTKDRFSKYVGLLPGSVYYLCDREGLAVINPVLPPNKFRVPVFVAANDKVAILWDVAMSGPEGKALKSKLLTNKKNDIITMSTPMSSKIVSWKNDPIWATEYNQIPPKDPVKIDFGINIQVLDSDENNIPGARVWVGVPSSKTRTSFTITEGITDRSGSFVAPFPFPIEEFSDDVIIRVRSRGFKSVETTGNYDKNNGGLCIIINMQTDNITFFEPDQPYQKPKNESVLAKLGKDLLNGELSDQGGFSALSSKKPPEKPKTGDMWLNLETLETSVFDGTSWLGVATPKTDQEPTVSISVDDVTDFVRGFAEDVGLDPDLIKVTMKSKLATWITIIYPWGEDQTATPIYLNKEIRRINKEIIGLLRIFKIFVEQNNFTNICNNFILDQSRKFEFLRGTRPNINFDINLLQITISLLDSAVLVQEWVNTEAAASEAMYRLLRRIKDRNRSSLARKVKDEWYNPKPDSKIMTMGVDLAGGSPYLQSKSFSRAIMNRDDNIDAMDFAREMLNLPQKPDKAEQDQDLEKLIRSLEDKPELKKKLQKALRNNKKEGRTAENELGNRPLDLD